MLNVAGELNHQYRVLRVLECVYHWYGLVCSIMSMTAHTASDDARERGSEWQHNTTSERKCEAARGRTGDQQRQRQVARES